MENALMEKTRIKDEAKAFAFAIEGQSKLKEVTSMLRSLKQRRDLAKELKAKGQVKLFDREIVRTGRAYRIEHANPYPECNKTDAMDAMCEPLASKSHLEGLQGSMSSNMQKSLGNAMGELQNYMSQPQGNMLRLALEQLRPFQTAIKPGEDYQMAQVNNPWSRYSQQTHKYDLACEVLNLDDLKVEGSEETQTMLPMSALCRLQEAKAKSLFDHMEVWRPAEWKAPDPWLVGVFYDTDGRSRGTTRYFKVCDWR